MMLTAPQPAAQGHEALRLLQKGGGLHILLPKLDHPGPAPDGGLNLPEQRRLVPCPGPVRHGVEPQGLPINAHINASSLYKNRGQTNLVCPRQAAHYLPTLA